MNERKNENERSIPSDGEGLNEKALLEAERELEEVERALLEPFLRPARRVALLQERRECRLRLFGVRMALERDA